MERCDTEIGPVSHLLTPPICFCVRYGDVLVYNIGCKKAKCTYWDELRLRSECKLIVTLKPIRRNDHDG